MLTKFVLLLYVTLFAFADGQTLESDKPSSSDARRSVRHWNTRTERTSEDANSDDNDTSRAGGVDLRWWTQVPVLPLVFATSNTLPEGRCKKQVQRYLRDLANSTLWAAQMFDASTKYPDGVLSGHTKHLGNFDQCYDLRAQLPQDDGDPGYDGEVEGRYCLVRLRYQRKDVVPTPPESFTLDFDPHVSVWDAIDDRGDFRRVKRNSVYVALCVPASCSAKQVSLALTEPLNELAEARGLRVETTVKPSFCQARRDAPENLSTGAKVFCFFVATLVVLVLGSSWYDGATYSADSVNEDGKALDDILLCFSARRNWRSIFSTAADHPGLDCIHLIRFFFTSLTIFGHRGLQYTGYPLVDATLVERMYVHRVLMTLVNGPIIVDGFFGIGGLLLAYGLLKEFDRRKRFNFTGLVLMRFLRLTPLYMVVVFFYATVLPHMGSGPFWEATIGSQRDFCSKNWWTNLLYLNNYVNQSEISWYLSADFQLHILGLIVIWAFWKLPSKWGYSLITALIAIGIAIPFFVTYTNDLQPLHRLLPFMRELSRDPYYRDYYIKSHMRIGPYMVGVLAGALIYDHKGSTWRLSKTWSRILFMIFPVFLSITSQSLCIKYYDPNFVQDPLEAAAYAGLHKTTFTLGICSIVVLITVGDGLEFHQNLMTPRWVPPLARLTYGAYLIHHINQGYEIGVTRRPFAYTVHNVLWDFVPDMVCTFGLSLLLSIAIEGPLRRIEKFVLAKRPVRSSINRFESADSRDDAVKKTK